MSKGPNERGDESSQGRERRSELARIEAEDARRTLAHEYDGIRELDYPLPRWWLAILWLTVVFAVAYSAYYLPGFGPALREEMNASLAEIEASKPKPSAGTTGAEAFAQAESDPTKLSAGAAVYAGKCVPCHGDKGQGLIGPNLTDDFWIHGDGSAVAIAKVIAEGVVEKGMPPWSPVLSPEELRDVVAFVRSLHGTNPPGAKEAQGEKRERP